MHDRDLKAREGRYDISENCSFLIFKKKALIIYKMPPSMKKMAGF